MKSQIDAILEPFRKQGIDAGCEHDGTFWQVWIGSKAGARKDGVSLAKFLAAEDVEQEPVRPVVRKAPASVRPDAMAKAVPVDAPIPIPEFLAEPEAPDPRLELQAARIAELEALLAAKAEPEPDAVPDDLSDLVDMADTPSETNAKLLAKWNETNGLIQLAHDRGERPSMDLIRKRDRLESGIRWNRGRLAEQI